MAWWIAGGVVGTIAVIIVFLLLTPLYVCVENTQEKAVHVSGRYLWFRFPPKQKKSPESPLAERMERLLGVDTLKGLGDLKTVLHEQPLTDVVKQITTTVGALLDALFSLLRKGTVNRLSVHAVSAAEDAAAAAIGYGAACSVIYGLVGYIQSVARVRKTACQVDVQCRYDTTDVEFDYQIVVSFRAFWVLRALCAMMKKDASQ